MDYILKREAQVPGNATVQEYPEIKYAIYTWPLVGNRSGFTFARKIFSGRRSKPDSYTGFHSEFEMVNENNKFIMERTEIAIQEQQRKADKKQDENETFKNIKVGDIFHQGGGYDQTNCRFYQLISLKKKTGTFRAISMNTVEGSEGFMSCREMPAVDKFVGEAFTSRITGDRIKPGYDRAYKCSPTASFYHSWYA